LNVDAGKILIIGRNGQVARSLSETLTSLGHQVCSIGRPDVDLLHPQTIFNAVLDARPNWVINASAYTAVDRAEEEPEVARVANSDGAQAAAAAAAKLGAPIIHFSTDYVFDGSKRTPYVETDQVSPIGFYGKSKLAGETLVAQANPKHVILRTAWVFSPFGSNFAKTMLRLNQERPTINVVDDQVGSPTYAPDLADVVRRIVLQLEQAPNKSNGFGLFHAVNAVPATWFAFAKAIVEGAANRGAPRAIVNPIETKDYPTKAERPQYSILSTNKLADVYGIRMRPWPEALRDALDLLVGPPRSEASNSSQQDFSKSA
jgi:dTDP-4-dehydrorhamnose reductase